MNLPISFWDENPQKIATAQPNRCSAIASQVFVLSHMLQSNRFGPCFAHILNAFRTF